MDHPSITPREEWITISKALSRSSRPFYRPQIESLIRDLTEAGGYITFQRADGREMTAAASELAEYRQISKNHISLYLDPQLEPIWLREQCLRLREEARTGISPVAGKPQQGR